ncbi:Serine/threonine kinase mps1 [Gurleya vavrai]
MEDKFTSKELLDYIESQSNISLTRRLSLYTKATEKNLDVDKYSLILWLNYIDVLKECDNDSDEIRSIYKMLQAMFGRFLEYWIAYLEFERESNSRNVMKIVIKNEKWLEMKEYEEREKILNYFKNIRKMHEKDDENKNKENNRLNIFDDKGVENNYKFDGTNKNFFDSNLEIDKNNDKNIKLTNYNKINSIIENNKTFDNSKEKNNKIEINYNTEDKENINNKISESRYFKDKTLNDSFQELNLKEKIIIQNNKRNIELNSINKYNSPLSSVKRLPKESSLKKNFLDFNDEKNNFNNENKADKNILNLNDEKKNISNKNILDFNDENNNIKKANILDFNDEKNIFFKENISKKNILDFNDKKKNFYKENISKKNILDFNDEKYNLKKENISNKNILNLNDEKCKNLNLSIDEKKNLNKENLLKKNILDLNENEIMQGFNDLMDEKKSKKKGFKMNCNFDKLDQPQDYTNQINRIVNNETPPKNYFFENDIYLNGNKLKVIREIGKGGSCRVDQVVFEDKIYALKKVNIGNENETVLQGYLDEIRFLEKLKGSEEIIQLVDFEKKDETLFLLMEYGETDLANLIKNDKKSFKSINYLKNLWERMLLAIKRIHDARIVHRDLKPANFLLVKGKLKLIDFGISKAIRNDTTNINFESHLGTLNYMAPEATDLEKSKMGRSSDIWSLGCIFYEMLYGHPPLYHCKNLATRFKILQDRNTEIEFKEKEEKYKQAISFVKKCLKKDAKERKTVDELLKDDFIDGGDKILMRKKDLVDLTKAVWKINGNMSINIKLHAEKIVDEFLKKLEARK